MKLCLALRQGKKKGFLAIRNYQPQMGLQCREDVHPSWTRPIATRRIRHRITLLVPHSKRGRSTSQVATIHRTYPITWTSATKGYVYFWRATFAIIMLCTQFFTNSGWKNTFATSSGVTVTVWALNNSNHQLDIVPVLPLCSSYWHLVKCVCKASQNWRPIGIPLKVHMKPMRCIIQHHQ